MQWLNQNILSAYLLLSFAIVSSAAICDSGIYAALAPLSTYAPAQSFCSAKYPAGTVTITKRDASLLAKRKTTTISTKASTTTKASTITKAPTTTKASMTTKSTSTTGSDPKSSLLSSLSAAAASVAKQFCSCIESSKTVTVSTSTTSTTPIPAPSNAIPCSSGNDCAGGQSKIGADDKCGCYGRQDGGSYCAGTVTYLGFQGCTHDSDCTMYGGGAFCTTLINDQNLGSCGYYGETDYNTACAPANSPSRLFARRLRG